MKQTGESLQALGESDINIDSSMQAFPTIWGDLRVASYIDNDGNQVCGYVDSRGNIFKIDGKIVTARSDTKIIDGREYAPACVEGITRYYDKNFQPLTQDRLHPRIVYRTNGEYFIDKILQTHNTIWGTIRKVQHNHPSHTVSCNHFMIDDRNEEVVNRQGKALLSIGLQREIEGKQYQRATFDDGVRRYYDADFQPLPIRQGVEEIDDDIVDIKELKGTVYVLRQKKIQPRSLTSRERSDWGHIDNGVNSHSFNMKRTYSKPEIWGIIGRDGETYIVIKIEKGEKSHDVIIYDVHLNQIGEYPIWKVQEGNIREAVIQRLKELIPET